MGSIVHNIEYRSWFRESSSGHKDQSFSRIFNHYEVDLFWRYPQLVLRTCLNRWGWPSWADGDRLYWPIACTLILRHSLLVEMDALVQFESKYSHLVVAYVDWRLAAGFVRTLGIKAETNVRVALAEGQSPHCCAQPTIRLTGTKLPWGL